MTTAILITKKTELLTEHFYPARHG